jgi:hypothetical protein
MKKETFSSEISNLTEDERRLFFSSAFVILILSLIVSHLFTRNMLWKMIGTESIVEIEKNNLRNEKVYNVLLEQEFKDKQKKDEIKALSDEDAAGTGGLTEKQGFHTSSPFYEFMMGALPSSKSPEQKETKPNDKEVDLYEVGIFHADPMSKIIPKPSTNPTQQSVGEMTKIPFNYRFEQDFLFRWDGSKVISLPRKQLAGYHYFKNMLRKIENSFYPPGGGNYAYRDMAGTVVREGILPGEVKVQFLLNDTGDVIDVKLMAGQGQKIVENACIESIRGQNFGVVPPEVRENGMIFGINFVFPDILRYR